MWDVRPGGTFDNSPAIYRRDTREIDFLSPVGTIEMNAIFNRPHGTPLILSRSLPGDKSPGYFQSPLAGLKIMSGGKL
jgi:hypothetical protein